MLEPDSELHMSMECYADVKTDRGLILGESNRPGDFFGVWAYHAESDVKVFVHHAMDHMDSGNHLSHFVLEEPLLSRL